jgi:hypothetical protein
MISPDIINWQREPSWLMVRLGPNNKSSIIAEDDDSGKQYDAKITEKLDTGAHYARVRHYKLTDTGKYGISVRPAN